MFKKIFIEDNFLNKKECKILIDHYKSKPLPREFDGTYTRARDTNVSNKLLNKINNLSLSLNQSIIDWFQIVKWPASHPGRKLHFDQSSSNTILSSILYLNSDFEGGHTYFEDGTSIAPKTGRIIFFDGNYYYHGVSSINNRDRYTLAAWYKKQ